MNMQNLKLVTLSIVKKTTLMFGTFVLAVAPVQGIEIPSPVVDSDWLEEHHGDVTIVDIRRDPDTFADGHIPGAGSVLWDEVLAERVIEGVAFQYILPEADTFTELMQSAGIPSEGPVVIASPGEVATDMTIATRLYWQLMYFGYDENDLAILDGGNAAWVESGRELATGEVKIDRGSYKVTATRDDLLAEREDIHEALESDDVQLIDNRPQVFFLGLAQEEYVYARGHIPGAINIPFILNIESGSPAALRDKATLSNIHSFLGTDQQRPDIIHYCNSGHVSSLTWFVQHQIMGLSQARLFDGSMHAWTRDESNPVDNPASQ